jgi:hypothetical protein
METELFGGMSTVSIEKYRQHEKVFRQLTLVRVIRPDIVIALVWCNAPRSVNSQEQSACTPTLMMVYPVPLNKEDAKDTIEGVRVGDDGISSDVVPSV